MTAVLPRYCPPRRYAKVDGRRVLVVVVDGFDGYVVRHTQHCSGCTEVPEMTSPPDRGFGCEECGYTGRRRWEHWIPFDVGAFERHLTREEAQHAE